MPDRILCDSCGQEAPLTDGCQTGTADICERCMDGWRAMSAQCEHEWEFYSGDAGDGRICAKCSRYQVQEAGHAMPDTPPDGLADLEAVVAGRPVEIITRLIAEARVLAGGDHPCAILGHKWVHTGGRWCGCEGSESRGCSVPVRECASCGDCDYGDSEESDEVRAECAWRSEAAL